jgi:murein DD-endopeptidase MepM/ murein hydrolase activator NlpD
MRRAIMLGLFLLLGLAAAVPVAAADGWTWPLPGPDVVRGFEPPAQPWLPGHRGVDLAGKPGEPVRAAGTGTVSYAGSVAGLPVVSIEHAGGLVTTYEPVRSQLHRGQPVATGAVIGRLVRAGSHCLPQACLHWGLRRGSDYLDPLTLVGAAAVRLLPVPAEDKPAPIVPAAGAGSAALVAVVLLGRRRRHKALGQPTNR